MMDEDKVPPTSDPGFMWGAQAFLKSGVPYVVEDTRIQRIGFAHIPVVEVVMWAPVRYSGADIVVPARQTMMKHLKEFVGDRVLEDELFEYVQFSPRISWDNTRRRMKVVEGRRQFGWNYEVRFELDKKLVDMIEWDWTGRALRMKGEVKPRVRSRVRARVGPGRGWHREYQRHREAAYKGRR